MRIIYEKICQVFKYLFVLREEYKYLDRLIQSGVTKPYLKIRLSLKVPPHRILSVLFVLKTKLVFFYRLRLLFLKIN